MNASCIFCRIINREVPSSFVLETEDCIVINDIAPKAPIHYLIIPKKHLSDIRSFEEQDMQIGNAMFELVKQLSHVHEDIPFRLLMNNGHEAGQRVMHAHMHFLAGIHMTD